MPRHLHRYHHTVQIHFVTFSGYRRQQNFCAAQRYDLFLTRLEGMRLRFHMFVYGYVVMPEHVLLLLSEPKAGTPSKGS